MANQSEHRLSCKDSANGDMLTNIRLCVLEREREETLILVLVDYKTLHSLTFYYCHPMNSAADM